MSLHMRTRNGLASVTGGKRCTAATARSWRLLVVAATVAQFGVGFDLSWNTIDGGGGASTGGGFELSATIGQADATPRSALTGGDFALTGGFWGAVGPLCTSFVAPDFDMDCDVDLNDYAAFLACGSGPSVALTAGCGNKDLDADGDADQDDFGIFQRCYSGSGNPAVPNCAD